MKRLASLAFLCLFLLLALGSEDSADGVSTTTTSQSDSAVDCDALAAQAAKSCCTGCGAAWTSSCQFTEQSQATCLLKCITTQDVPAECQ